MLIGRTGNWILKSPFNKYGTTGLKGKIVELIYMHTASNDGRNISQEVYKPVNWEAGFREDYSDNLILVTIESKGKEYTIPDKYIENLYDNSLFYQTTYITAKLGRFPRSYDFKLLQLGVLEKIREILNTNIREEDVILSRSFLDADVLSSDDSVLAEAKRLANFTSGKYETTETKYKNLEEKYKNTTEKLKNAEKFLSKF